MTQVNTHLSTGLAGLDRVLRGLIPGDNIVWQVDAIDDYLPFIPPFCQVAEQLGQKLVYFRFAKHQPLLKAEKHVTIHELDPNEGFEAFVTKIHKAIEAAGPGGYYVFDCLSDLAENWYSDQMLGNFFMLTCPYLFDEEAIAYFALLRGQHSQHALNPISETTQVLLNVYRHKGRLYLHPVKAQQRYSRSMYMPHVWEGDELRPIHESAAISEILSGAFWLQTDATTPRLGVWHRTLFQAEEMSAAIKRGNTDPQHIRDLLCKLMRMLISRDERVLSLIQKYLTIPDILEISRRMLGTGLIGGKSVGMLLGRAILRHNNPRWEGLLEPHDSFFIGSDVFFTFLVRNGIWWVREKQRNPATFLEGAERARQRMLTGTFPDHIVKQMEAMLDYFGQSPIIVRSSSLLEDNFGNAFAGKYESVFCANQGPKAKRLEDFLSAVRTIYASTMSKKALTYRAQRGMLERDEQMALLVQRVSGSLHGDLFFPHVAGVAFSFNPYVWSEKIDPSTGMLRLVFGLGTRAVDRSDDDYTRVIALNDPTRRPEENFDEVRQYSQKKVDVLDLEANQLTPVPFSDVARKSSDIPLDLFASRDTELEQRMEACGTSKGFPWVLTFEHLLSGTSFVSDMSQMLRTLHKAYDYPVDVEFTANLVDASSEYKINLLQCRPLQVKEGGNILDPPANIDKNAILLEAHGAVIGKSRLCEIERFIYISPSVYGHMSIQDRYEVARLIGRLTHLDPPGRQKLIMLLGPGRWGTTTPSLGVPVSFHDINTVSIICEIVAMRDDLVPDVSLGTHFFNDLVEMDMLYLALFPSRPDSILNKTFFEQSHNRLVELMPEDAKWAQTVKVIDPTSLPSDKRIQLNANSLKQRTICYID